MRFDTYTVSDRILKSPLILILLVFNYIVDLRLILIMQIHIHMLFVLFLLFISFRIRRFPGMKETQLTADVELLPTATVETSKSKQQTRPPISMNFEVNVIS